MAIHRGPDLNTDGLVFCADGANHKSYPGTGTSVYNISGIEDSSGNSITGTMQSSTTWDNSSGAYGMGSFDMGASATDYISFGPSLPVGFRPTETDLEVGGDGYTVSIWILPDTTVNNRGVWCNDGATSSAIYYGLQLLTDSGGRPGLLMCDGTGNTSSDYRFKIWDYTLQLNQWQNLTFSPAQAIAGKFILWVNGKSVSGTVSSGGTGGDISYSASLTAGLGRAAGLQYTGRFGGCWTWNRQLSSAEVKDHYQKTKDKYVDPA